MRTRNYLHELEFLVRDYECDLQGIVNNAVYQNYLEHARNEILHSMGIGFARLHQQGTDAVVTRIEMDFRAPLRSRDRFVVRSNLRREGRLRIVFDQDIYRLPEEKLVVEARVVAVFLRNGRPVAPKEIFEALERSFGGSIDF